MRAAPSGKGSTRGVVPVRRPAIDRSAAFDPDDFEPTRALPSQPEPELSNPSVTRPAGRLRARLAVAVAVGALALGAGGALLVAAHFRSPGPATGDARGVTVTLVAGPGARLITEGREGPVPATLMASGRELRLTWRCPAVKAGAPGKPQDLVVPLPPGSGGQVSVELPCP